MLRRERIRLKHVAGLKKEPLFNDDKGIRKLRLILNNSLIKPIAYLKYLKEDI